MLQIYKSNLNYKAEFNKLAIKIKKILGNNISIEHVGSTALNNVDGKGIIDILIGVKDINELNIFKDKLISAGYYSSDHDNHGDYIFLASSKSETILGDYHIHLVLFDSKKFNDYINLRNYFNNNPDRAKEYSDLKHKLAKLTDNNRREYKRLKSEYIEAILKKLDNK